MKKDYVIKYEIIKYELNGDTIFRVKNDGIATRRKIKEFLKKGEDIFEINKFYDFEGILTDSVLTNLTILNKKEKYSHENGILLIDKDFRRSEWIYKVNWINENFFVIKTGFKKNFQIERYVFDKNNDLIEVYF